MKMKVNCLLAKAELQIENNRIQNATYTIIINDEGPPVHVRGIELRFYIK